MKTISAMMAVAWKEFQLISRDRGNLVLLLLLPLLLSSVQSSANLAAQGEGETSILLHVALVNEDSGDYGREAANALLSINELDVQLFGTLDKAEALVARGELAAAIYFPASFSADIDSHQQTMVEVVVDPAQPQSASIVTGIMNQVIDEVTIWGEVQYGIRSVFEASGLLSDLSEQELRGLQAMNLGVIMTRLGQMRSSPLIRVTSEDLEGLATEDWFAAFMAYIFAGYVAMFVFFIVPMAAESILQEREVGTLRRLVAAPIAPAAVIGGKLMAYLLIPCVQAVLIFSLASIAFDIPLGNSPLALILMTLTAAVTAAALGFLIASLAKTSSQANNMGVAAGFILAIVGGAVPIAGHPFSRSEGVMSVIARFTPQAHALEGYLKVIADGKDFMAVLPEAGILLAFTAVFLFIAIRRFRYD